MSACKYFVRKKFLFSFYVCMCVLYIRFSFLYIVCLLNVILAVTEFIMSRQICYMCYSRKKRSLIKWVICIVETGNQNDENQKLPYFLLKKKFKIPAVNRDTLLPLKPARTLFPIMKPTLIIAKFD